MLSRPEFEEACKALIAKYQSVASTRGDIKGWLWNEHPSIPGFGYMSRSAIYTWRANTISTDSMPTEAESEDYSVEMEDDPSAIDHIPERDILTCQQYVVYSVTFQVPAFYFTLHTSNGSALALTDLVRTTLFHPYSFSETVATTFGLTRFSSPFPLLSQGEHPTLGTPCWYLHPCESANAVEELLSACNEADGSALQRFVRWVELWFMVVGTAVNVHNTL